MALNPDAPVSSDKQTMMIEYLMKQYQERLPFYSSIAETAAKICSTALYEAGVRHDVEYHVIETGSLKRKLNAVGRQSYRDIVHVEANLSLVEVHAIVYSWLDKCRVRDVLSKKFDMQSVRNDVMGNGTRAGSDENTEHCWVTLKEDDGEEQEEANNSHQSTMIEVKVMFSVDEETPVDSLESLHQRYMSQMVLRDTPFTDPFELGLFLSKWAVENGKSRDLVGDVQPLWQLLQELGLRQPKQFQKVLDQMEFPFEVNAASNSRYGSFTLRIVDYVIDRVIHLFGKAKLNEAFHTKTRDDLLRYKINVVKNAMIWLSHLFRPSTLWVGLLISAANDETETAQKTRICWLSCQDPREFCDRETPLTSDEVANVEKLWLMFQENRHPPVQYVFRLARMGVRGGFPTDWPSLNEALSSVFLATTHAPYYFSESESGSE